MSFNFEIPLLGPKLPDFASQMGGDLSISMNASQAEATKHKGGTIKVAGKLKMDIKDGEIVGTKIEADIVDISAENLLVKSVQDTMKSSSRGFSLSLDPTDLFSGKMPTPENLLKGIYGEGGGRSAEVTNSLGSIIGKEATKIVVQDTLTMVGGLIESASRDEHGNLTNKGAAQVRAANIIIEKLHDYDEGVTLGLGINPVSSSSKSPFGPEVRTKFQLKDKSRDVHSALIGLQVTVDGEIIGSANLKSTAQPEQMQGADIDLDVSFASVDVEKLQTKEETLGASAGDQEKNFLEETWDAIKKLLSGAEEELVISDEENKLAEEFQPTLKEFLSDTRVFIKYALLQQRTEAGEKTTAEISEVEDFYISQILKTAMAEVDHQLSNNPKSCQQFIVDLRKTNLEAIDKAGENVPLQIVAALTNSLGESANFGLERIGYFTSDHLTSLKVGAEVARQVVTDVVKNFCGAVGWVGQNTFSEETWHSLTSSASKFVKGVEENTTEGQRTFGILAGASVVAKGAIVLDEFLVERAAFRVPDLSHITDNGLKQKMFKQHYYKHGVLFEEAEVGGELMHRIAEVDLNKHKFDMIVKRVVKNDPEHAQVAEGMKGWFKDVSKMELKDDVVSKFGLIGEVKDLGNKARIIKEIEKSLILEGKSLDNFDVTKWIKGKSPETIKTNSCTYRIHGYVEQGSSNIIKSLDYKLKIDPRTRGGK